MITKTSNLKKWIWIIVLLPLIAGVAFVGFPRNVNVTSDPEEIIYHDYGGSGVVKINLKEGDPISEEIANFLQENTTGWRIIIKSLSLGETVPSIEVWGEGNSYSMVIWKNEVVLGFMKPEKSYRKRIDPKYHAKLVELINKYETNKTSNQGMEPTSANAQSDVPKD